jgi:hypothetical protein
MNDLILDSLAVFRIWRLVALDEITEAPRARWEEWAWNRYGKTEPGRAQKVPKIITLVGCPWCLGAWMVLGALAWKRVSPRTWSVARTALATSAVVGLLGSKLETE